MSERRPGNGVVIRHSRSCRCKRTGLSPICTCEPSYEAWFWDNNAFLKRRRTFSTYAEAKAWRRLQLNNQAPVLTLTRRAQIAKRDYDDAVRQLARRLRKTA